MGMVSITEAARRLTALGDQIDRSTLSRYLGQHAEALPVVRDGRQGLVEFDDLLAHRRENVRIAAAGNLPVTSPRVAPATPSPGATRFVGSQADGAARKVNAEAELRELDLAERQRRLTPRGEVDKAGRDAVALMIASFDLAVETTVAAAAVRYGWDERQLRLVLKQHTREGLGVFHREILDRIERLGETPAGEGCATET